MGIRTPNMSIYIPSRGEDLYSSAFLAGMQHVDAHDHSGAPENGVQIGTNGIRDGAITPAKLSNAIIIYDEVTTTDATPVEIASVSMVQSSALVITGRMISLKLDGTKCLGADFTCVFRRPTAGSPGIVGLQEIDINTDFVGTATMFFQADIIGNAAQIMVQGEAASTINWRTEFNVLQYP
jgi:hypothetical protein